MSKIFMTILFLISCLAGHASIVKFDINLKYKNGKTNKTSKAIITTELGKEFSIEKNNFKALFIAKKYSDKNGPVPPTEDTLLIEAKIYDIIDGKEKLISTPKIIMPYNREGIISIESDNKYVEMQITSTRL